MQRICDRNKNLKKLNLSVCLELATLLKEIENLTNLKELDLTYTKISQAEKANIKKMLPNCKIYE